MSNRENLRFRAKRSDFEIEEINEDQDTKEIPKKSSSISTTLNAAIDGLNLIFSDLRGMFSPTERKKSLGSKTEHESTVLPSPSANHPGIEGVDMADAVEQCPHLKEIMEKRRKKDSEGSCCDHPCHLTAGQTSGKCPVDHTQANDKSGKCPVDHKSANFSPGAQCPYQDPEAHEWPMRAVLTFVAFNFISTGVSAEAVKIGFVIMACYMGMLKAGEFAVLYVTTASMSSYKLLGLLLMLTNKGGPKWDPKMYRVSLSTIAAGILTGVLAIGLAMLVKEGEIAFEIYKPAPLKEAARALNISPLFDLVVPILNEFVYRQYMLTELGRDLGTWFGLLGSSVWYGVMLRASKAKLLANFFQGLFLGCAMLISKKNLVIPTIAHAVYRIAFGLFPSLNQFVVQ